MKHILLTTALVLSTTAAHAGFLDVLTGKQSLAELNAEHEQSQKDHFAKRAARTGEAVFTDTSNIYVVTGEDNVTVVSKREAAAAQDPSEFIRQRVLSELAVDGAHYDGQGWHFEDAAAEQRFLDSLGAISEEELQEKIKESEERISDIKESLQEATDNGDLKGSLEDKLESGSIAGYKGPDGVCHGDCG